MSVNAENSADVPVACDSERASEPVTEISRNLIEERIKATLELLNAQNSTFTQLLS